jgi:hypothetical protein
VPVAGGEDVAGDIGNALSGAAHQFFTGHTLFNRAAVEFAHFSGRNSFHINENTRPVVLPSIKMSNGFGFSLLAKGLPSWKFCDLSLSFSCDTKISETSLPPQSCGGFHHFPGNICF